MHTRAHIEQQMLNEIRGVVARLGSQVSDDLIRAAREAIRRQACDTWTGDIGRWSPTQRTRFNNARMKLNLGNEADVGSWYRFSFAPTRSSGLSFGPPQFDIGPAGGRRAVLAGILRANGWSETRTRETLDLLVPMDGSAWISLWTRRRSPSEAIRDAAEAQWNAIAQAIRDVNAVLIVEGRKDITNPDGTWNTNNRVWNAYLGDLDENTTNLATWINQIEASGQRGAEAVAYVRDNPFMLLLVTDFTHQFGAGGLPNPGNGDTGRRTLREFVTAGQVQISGDNVQVCQTFDVIDYMRFYLNTPYARTRRNAAQGANDLLRRIANAVAVARGCGVYDGLGQRERDFLDQLVAWHNDNEDRRRRGQNVPDRRQAIRDLLNNADPTCPLPQRGLVPEPRMADVGEVFRRAAFAPAPMCPIMLDLDGDGVETTAATAGAFFDHEGDGFAEATGWVDADDGLLVWDRNGDGRINDGRELFGNNTMLRSGRRAAHGFEALAEWDDNADGRIDASDAVWANLRIWRDLDRNGFSAPDELRLLSDVGVAAINLAYTTSGYVDPHGNEHRQVGSFVRSGGGTRTATNVWVRRDLATSLPEAWLDVPADIQALPDAQGSGVAYNLHQAMVRDAGRVLKGLVEAFVAQTDPAQRRATLEQILFKWTGSDGIDPASRGPNIDARRLVVLERFMGEGFVGTTGSNPHINAAVLLEQTYRTLAEFVYAQLTTQSHLRTLYERVTWGWDEEAQILKGDLSSAITELRNGLETDPPTGRVLLAEFARILRGFGAEDNVDYWDFRESFAAQDETLRWLIDSAGRNPITRTPGDDDWWGIFRVGDAVRGLAGNDRMFGSAGDDVFYGDEGTDELWGNDGNDLLVGGTGNDNLNGGDGHDRLEGGPGDDVLVGLDGDDALLGGEGRDALSGGRGHDRLYGGPGNDELWGDEGDDVLDGGPGNDHLDLGPTGFDTLIFSRGTGQDVVEQFSRGNPALDRDVVRVATGIRPDEVTARRIGNDLVLGIVGTSDQLTLRGYFVSLPRPDDEEVVTFADGTAWNRQFIRERVRIQIGTEGTDFLYGHDEQNDVLRGMGGDDGLYGRGGNDILEGGPGNDGLYGDAGDDDLDGGAGSDRLNGGAGNDTYRFGRGSGQDIIVDWSATPNLDVIQMGPNILPSQVTRRRSGDDLVLEIDGTSDRLVVQGYFDPVDPGYNVEEIRFEDGTVWRDVREPQVWTHVGTEGPDIITGTPGPDAINGLGGNDTLDGREGDDLLYGGSGNDTIYGGLGNDRLVGGLGDDRIQGGDGEDVLDGGDGIDRLWGEGGNDVLDGGEGNDILEGGPGHDVLYGRGGADTLNGGAGNDVLEGGDGNDTLAGYAGDDRLEGGLGDDTLYGDWGFDTGNDILDGGDGNDTLDGQNGDDILYGRAGIDTLRGGAGNDFLDGGDGNDSLAGYAGDDRLEGGAGDDVLWGDWGADTGNDILDGGDGNDTLEGQNGDDILYGRAGADILRGGAGNDILEGGDGNDSLAGFAGHDRLEGGAGDDVLWGDWGADTGNDVLDGGEGNDELHGQSGSDVLFGGAGMDRLWGDAGDDQLDGGDGDDILDGGDGNDFLYGGAGVDSLEGGAGDDVMDGGEGNDTLDGLNGDDVLYGRGGADTLRGGAGNDILEGEDGNDSLAGFAGNDRLNGGAGDDILWGDWGADVGDDILDGGDGNDELFGQAGNDVLYGRAGLDQLWGGTGNDTYVFGLGDGQDTVFENDATPGNTDTVAFAGRNPLALMLGRDGNNLRVAAYGSTDTLTIRDWYLSEAGQTEILRAGDGRQLLNTRVDALIQAMAEYSLQTGLTWEDAIAQRPDEVEAILSQYWEAPAGPGGGGGLGFPGPGWDVRAPGRPVWEWGVRAPGRPVSGTPFSTPDSYSRQAEQFIHAVAGFATGQGIDWERPVLERPEEVQLTLAANGMTAG